jgi:hypothetical protein
MINPAVVRYQRLAIWSGIAFVLLFFVSIVMAGFFPPPSPTLTGPQLAAAFAGRLFWLKAGMPVAIVAAALSFPFNAILAGHIARIEGRDGGMPLLAFTSLGAGTINTLFFFLPFIIWSGAFYRADRDPTLLLLMNDTAWLAVVMLFSPLSIQNVTVALAGFLDKDSDPVFPRWCCYAMLLCALLYVPGPMGIFFFTGPFAWNGLFVFWVPANVLGIQFIILAYCMLKHINHQERTA